MAAAGGMSPEQVKSTCKGLETSPSKSQGSSPIYGGGSSASSGGSTPSKLKVK